MEYNYSEIMLLFHPPTIFNVLGVVGLSFHLLTCVQKMRNHSNPYWYIYRGKRG